MNDAKYAKLLSDASGLNAKANFYKQQLHELSENCNNHAALLNSNLDDINQKLLALNISHLLPPTKDQLEVLHSIDRSLQQQRKLLHKELETAAVKYSKEIAKLELQLQDRVIAVLSKELKPDDSKSAVIQTIINNTTPIFSENKQSLAQCLSIITESESKIAQLENKVRELDLPNEIESTTKQLNKLTEDLTRLNLQLSVSNIRRQYQREFLPLRNALAKLETQSSGLRAAGTQEQSLEPDSHNSSVASLRM